MSDPDPNKLWDKVKKVSMMCILIGIVMGVSNLIEVSIHFAFNEVPHAKRSSSVPYLPNAVLFLSAPYCHLK